MITVSSTFDIYLHEPAEAQQADTDERRSSQATHLVRIRAVVEQHVPLAGEAELQVDAATCRTQHHQEQHQQQQQQQQQQQHSDWCLAPSRCSTRRLKLSLLKRSYLGERIEQHLGIKRGVLGGLRPRVVTL